MRKLLLILFLISHPGIAARVTSSASCAISSGAQTIADQGIQSCSVTSGVAQAIVYDFGPYGINSSSSPGSITAAINMLAKGLGPSQDLYSGVVATVSAYTEITDGYYTSGPLREGMITITYDAYDTEGSQFATSLMPYGTSLQIGSLRFTLLAHLWALNTFPFTLGERFDVTAVVSHTEVSTGYFAGSPAYDYLTAHYTLHELDGREVNLIHNPEPAYAGLLLVVLAGLSLAHSRHPRG